MTLNGPSHTCRQSESICSKLFVDVFVVVHIIPTLIVLKDPSKALLNSLMDPSWNEKIYDGQDIIICFVSFGIVILG